MEKPGSELEWGGVGRPGSSVPFSWSGLLLVQARKEASHLGSPRPPPVRPAALLLTSSPAPAEVAVARSGSP